jgi:hypothetical protein
MLRLAKWALIALAIAAVIWTGVILWWQSSQREITTGEVLTYLVILPAAVISGIVFTLWLRSRKNSQNAFTESGTTPATIDSQEQEKTDNAAADSLPILAAWSITSAGSWLTDFHAALVDKRRRPQPDAGLLDDYGYPLHTGRVDDIDTSAVEQALAKIQAHNANLANLHVDVTREGFLRVLTLLSLLLDQVVTDWPIMENFVEDAISAQAVPTLRGSEAGRTDGKLPLQLQIKLIIPADFTTAEQQLALSYFLEHSRALPCDSRAVHIQLVPSRDEPTALHAAEHFRIEAHGAAQPQALLLIACDSALCNAVTERWQAERKLFGSHARQGLMPGEAAFAIFCINRKALDLSAVEPVCLLRGVTQGRRDTSADSGGKPVHAALDAIVGKAIALASLQCEDIATIACDADHRSSRVLECIGAMLAHTPHLDAVENRLSSNEICGHVGAATSAAAWAAGIAQVRETEAPVLLVNVSHAFERAAAVLLPTQRLHPHT